MFTRNNSNNIAKKGIENLFDENLFEGFTVTVTDDSTGEQRKEFNVKKKDNFLKHVIPIADENNFKNFKPLFEYINSKIAS